MHIHEYKIMPSDSIIKNPDQHKVSYISCFNKEQNGVKKLEEQENNQGSVKTEEPFKLPTRTLTEYDLLKSDKDLNGRWQNYVGYRDWFDKI